MTDLPPLGAETDSAAGTPSLRFDLPAMGQEAGAQIGAPCLVFTPPEGRAEPTYYIYPKPETVIHGPDGPRLVRLEVNPGPDFIRVAPRGGNPNCFIRTNDPYRHLAEEAP